MQLHLSWLGLIAVAVAVAAAAGACGDDTSLAPLRPTSGRCVPPERSTDAALSLAPAFGGQKFTQPVEMILGPENRFYILEQKGVVRVLDATGAPATTVVDIVPRVISGGEAGLLGIAFDPKFAQNGFVYLSYTSPVPPPPIKGVVFQSVIARFHSVDGGKTIDAGSEKRLLVLDQPFANHDGGHIAFGPDGFLYIAFGDGGSGGDPMGNGQNKNVLLGKILRIDPNGGDPYGIPPSNPFANGGGRPEIFTYGMRNPWKFSFDTLTGDLWCGDVGQGKFEEVDRLVAGGNYGWSTREGKHCYFPTICSAEGLIDPVVEYDHSEGSSITGGFVYRGKKIPSLVGKYIYGDFGSGRIWAADKTGESSYAPILLAETQKNIATFGQDADGELYVADYGTGTLLQLVESKSAAPPSGVSVILSQTGCVDMTDTTKAAPGLIGYTVNSPLWSDGATKDRSLYVPENTKIIVMPDGDLDVPPGSVAVKTFSLAGKKIETRLFVRYADAMWAGYSYEWNDQQTDAALLVTGKTKTLADGSSWTFPSRAQCLACHTEVAGHTLGLEARQLDRDDDGRNQLERFKALLDKPIVPGALPPLRAADTMGATDEERARGYLHANCSFCHREGSGSGGATIDLRVAMPFADTKTCNTAPQAGDLGYVGAKIITPGDPMKSTLSLRMRTLIQARMPPLATHVVDETGATAVDNWIKALPPACP